MQDTPSPADAPAVLAPGRTAWRIAHASRFALLVDAADYFAAARAAMLKAERSIMLVGWDFDLRIDLVPDGPADDMPERLGPFLKALVRRKPHLLVRVLKWDMSVFLTVKDQMLPLFLLDLKAASCIRLRFDGEHPLTAAHHQKIAVIDDRLAFCGGIDMTSDRWDTRRHLPGDRRRRRPDGSISGPWHDATTVVDGEAARALGELARERWRMATGVEIDPPRAEGSDPWPDGVAPDLRDVAVGISRTMPAWKGRPAVREIEALHLAAIAAARRTIYLESQYLASVAVADAIGRRLGEADGPEVVIVNPLETAGWLQQETVGVARDLNLAALHRADRHGRLGIYHPVDAAGEAIYVHAKVLVVDDRLIRVGSSNASNRSMGFDTECDLSVEAGREGDRERIRAMRDDLLAEHLDRSPGELRAAIAEAGSLLGAVEALRRPEGRSLRPIPVRPVSDAEVALVRSRLADPERPTRPERRVQHLLKRLVLRAPATSAAVVLAAIALPVVALLAL